MAIGELLKNPFPDLDKLVPEMPEEEKKHFQVDDKSQAEWWYLRQKVLIVISDGEPAAHGYVNAEAVKDTVLAVRETEKMDTGVIGIYIGPERSVANAKMIYKNLIILNAVDLPPVIVRTLKKVITNSPA